MRKAQVTAFIIIGIAALLVISVIIWKVYSDRITLLIASQDADYSKKVGPVVIYADACISKVGLSAMSKLGEQGTIYPNIYIATKDRKISYFYFRGNGYFPSRQNLEDQISDYVRDNIKGCLRDFSETGFVVEDVGKGIQVKSSIADDRLQIEMSYPLNVYYESKIVHLEKFNTEIKTEFSGIYDLSEKIYSETKKNPDWINLESLQDSKYKVRLIKVDENTLVYEISDEKGLVSKPFRYTFAIKYDIHGNDPFGRRSGRDKHRLPGELFLQQERYRTGPRVREQQPCFLRKAGR
jgi:hypothetical protein